jgi:hypothetical protein
MEDRLGRCGHTVVVLTYDRPWKLLWAKRYHLRCRYCGLLVSEPLYLSEPNEILSPPPGHRSLRRA